MLPKSAIEKLIPILKKDARRALRMKVPGFARPYYCSFLLRDIHWFNTWASSGATYRKRSDHTRNVYCDIRVGNYRYDQTMEGGLTDNDEELESYSHVKLPIDDRSLDGLRIALWRLSETKVREAVQEYHRKVSQRISTVDRYRKLPSFVKIKRQVSIKHSRPEKVDEEKWAQFCKRASRWISSLAKVTANWVEFDASQVTKIFVNTEGSVVVQPSYVFTLNAGLRHLTQEGANLEQEIVINTVTQRELPDFREFKKQILKKYEHLLRLIRARKIHSFSGTVLLCPGPAGLLFHEAIGHRLEGSRLLSSGEGQTFKDQIGKKVIDVPVTVRDNPTLKKFQGVHCLGAYAFDDEGVKSQDTLLIEDGILKNFLTTRADCLGKSFKPNGHARTHKHQRPISRMGVTVIESKSQLSFADLKLLLMREIKRQKKNFGMIIYETSGGETETSSYDFQAFSGDISYATLVYADGHEVPVRGVNLVGTPLQALGNIIATGNDPEIDNGFCGAESGFIPITTISPSILLRNLELQAKDEELVTQYILPAPRGK